jgi:hypothetical protein
MLNVYKNQPSRQTGSWNVMGPNMLPTIWGTYMKLVTKYQIFAITMGKCSNAFFSETSNMIKAKLYMNVYWMVLYKL